MLTRIRNITLLAITFIGLLFVAGCQHQPTAASVEYNEDEVVQLRQQIEKMDWE